VAALSGGCGLLLSTKVVRPPAIHEFSSRLHLHDEELTLHLASPSTPVAPATPLIVYASGDGGWFGAAVGMFRTIAASGLPIVGISTKAFMRIEHRWSKPVSVAHVAEGYEQIIAAARTELRLPVDAPVLLTGWSRGASLGVLVASDGGTDARVVGVVAVGLVADEELDIEGDDDDPVSGSDAAPAVAGGDARKRSIAMYPLLSHLGPRRSVVIQASGDGYLPAIRARVLFGPDSTMSRLVVIDARNHRFSGGESSFAAALVKAVVWVSSSAAEWR
jgi:hypothetical protein